jgi:hypothetical protein
VFGANGGGLLDYVAERLAMRKVVIVQTTGSR